MPASPIAALAAVDAATEPVAIRGENAVVAIGGTFTATLLLESRRPGDPAFAQHGNKSYTAGTVENVPNGFATLEYRLRCSAYTSGTANCRVYGV